MTLGYSDTEVETTGFMYDGTATVTDNFKRAAASYNNAVDTLNNKAKTYMDTKEIATDARCLGSNSKLNSSSKFQGDTTSEMWSGIYNYLETYSWNNKFKNTDTNYSEDVKQLNDLGLNVSSGNIWLDSRVVESGSSRAYFGVRYMNSSNDTYYISLCYVISDGTSYSNAPSRGFRPVFLLPSNVTIISGNGSSESPYLIK